MDDRWLASSAVLAVLARIGLIVYATGMTRSKNAAGIVFRNIADVCVATLAVWLVGTALWSHSHSVIGFNRHDALGGSAVGLLLLITTLLPGTGAVAAAAGERSRLLPLCAVSAVLAGVVMPVLLHWTTHRDGWLTRLGLVDATGAAGVHLAAAAVAAVFASAVGARTGKYHRDGSTSLIPGHNLPLAGVGVLLALVGWLGYTHSPPTVLVTAAAGGFAAGVYGTIKFGKPDIVLTYSGLLGALFASTAAAGVGTRWGVVVGAIAGLGVAVLAVTLDMRMKLDDPTAAVAVHGGGAAIGLLLAPLFVSESLRQALARLGVAVLAIAVVTIVAGGTAWVLAKVLGGRARLRSSEADEYDGLDLAEHDVASYPDFQQNTIRSYHLREA